MIAVVMVATLAAWLLLVYSAARQPRGRDVRSCAASEPAPLPSSEEPAKPECEAAA